MAKQLNQIVNLSFTADTAKAKAQLQDLSNQLNSLIHSNTGGLGVTNGMSKEIERATNAAASLKVALDSATNVNTGKLDLGKFNESLQKGKMTLLDYRNALNSLGPAGTKAFAALSSSIMQAEVPIRRSNAALTQMLTTLKNTARWQISSMVLHGFMSSVQTAYNYAQDLNESLNNIRIVTGKNTDEMARFADQANKAAKALSTTTTQYTNASLIYYQQGLSNEEVLERTDVTIKMANAAGQSAEIVSDQMTAVWNNFDDGSRSLEYYADVMTALGAATASSTDEIAEGLQKFAAISETVGLSYEYATTALATVTATSRESADVVGTAFKTLFARIQDLELGKTLDDGTTLGSYAEGLAKVGINIKEANGELKSMDDVLNEMGSKWKTLNEDEKVALAQRVAGIRQYNQLMTLMNNWDYFQQNLDVVENAEGTLQEQADIYAESWEASEKRVQAAAERIYASLLDEDLFIGINNSLETVLTGVGNLVESFGGLPGVLSIIGATLSNVFGTQLTNTFDRLIYNIKMSTSAGRESVEMLRREMNELMVSDLEGMDTTAGYTAANAYKQQAIAQQALLDNAHKLSEEEQKHAQLLLDSHSRLVANVVKLGEEVQLEEQKVALAERSAEKQLIGSAVRGGATAEQARALANEAKVAETHLANINDIFYKLSTVKINGAIDQTKFQEFANYIKAEFGDNFAQYVQKGSKAFTLLGESGSKSLYKLMSSIKDGTIDIKVFDEVMDNLTFNGVQGVNKLIDIFQRCGMEEKEAIALANRLAEGYENLGNKTADLTDEQQRLKNTTDQVNNFLNNAKGPVQTLGSVFTASTQVITSFAMVLTSVKGIVDTLNNTEMSFGEKFLTIFTQMAFVLPNIVSMVGSLQTLMGPTGFLGAMNANSIAMKTLFTNYQQLNAETYKGIIASAIAKKQTDSQTKADLLAALVKDGVNDEKEQELILDTLLANKKMLLTKATIKETAAELANKAVKALKNPIVWASVAAIGALVAITYASIKAQNADAEAAKKAADAAKNLAEASNKAKQELEELESAVNAYDTAYEALEKCKEGTDEWREALEKVNDQTWDLLEKFPDLIKMANLFNEDGTLNRDAIEAYIQEQANKASNLQAAAIAANAKAAQADYVSDRTDTVRSIAAKAQEYATNGQYSYSMNSAVAAQFVDKFSEKLKDPTYTAGQYEADVRDWASKFEILDEEKDAFVDALIESRGELVALGNASDAAGTAMRNVGGLVGGDVLGNSATDDQRQAFGEEYSKAYDTAYEDAKDMFTVGVNRLSSRSDVMEQWKAYQEASGTSYSLASNAVIGTDDNRSFQYVDEDGSVKQITVEEMAEAIAAAEAKKVAEEASREDIVNNFATDEGTVINEDVGTALVNTLAQSVDLENEEQVAALTQLLSQHSDSAAEQRRIIEEFINSQTEEQKEESEVNSLISNASSSYELDPELIKTQAENLQELYEAEGLTRVEATKLAIENQRMNKGVESLIDNWEDWNKELKAGQLDKNKKGTMQYAKTIKDLTKTIADLTGASADLELPDEFFDSAENLELIEQAAKGSETAIAALGIEVASTGVEMAEQLSYVIRDSAGNILDGISTVDFENAKTTVLNGLAELQTQVLAGNDLIGQSLDNILSGGPEATTAWIDSMNEMALATNMSVDEMNSKLSEMGLEADVTVTEVQTTSRKPVTKTTIVPTSYDNAGNILEYETSTSTIRYDNVPETIQVAQIATNGADAGSPPVKYIGNGSVSPTTTGKKDSSGSTKKTKPKRSDTVKRYKEADDKLDNISKEMSKVNREMNQLYGSARISKMQQNISLMEDEVDILKAKREEAEAYKKVDKDLLEQAAKDAGVTFEFNADGTIKNYTEQMNLLHDRLEQAFNAGNTVLQEQIQQQISDLEAAISAYDDTLNTIEDLDEQIADNLDKIMRENYNVLTYKLELELELNDSELQKIEFELGLIADDFYKMAEAATLMMSQMGPYKDSLGDLANHYNDLNKAFADGKITQEDYINGLKEARDGIYDQLNALVELDKEMMEYYGNTLDAAMEELDKYTSHMEHLTGVIDHYMSLMELMGKSEDYEAMGSFLEARATTTKNELDVAKSNYDMLLKQKAQIEERMAGVEEGSAAWELYKKEWDAIVAATDEAQEEMLSKTEEWMEAMKAVIENNMKKAQKALEESLTGGTDFDTLMTEMDRLNARQEEYLTKTNQIYETNKLMRQAAQAADKTDNAVAKQKFKNFAEETKQLQEKGQLSKYELEIQQAKYDLLLAEIALEDAQNAKSTVRLQRDSEGNFGYVYTADQDQIANAQQAVEDAKNDLYNISLEGQQTYSEKYVQGLQQMNDEIAQLEADWLAGRITSQEEFEAKREAIEQHYFGVPDGILTTYSNLYNVAVQTDAQATADFWGKSYGAMTQNTEDFHTAVTTHFEAIDADMEKWEDITTTAQENITEGLDDLIEESDDYADTVNDEVIPAIEDELEAVEDLTAGYADQRAEVKRLIEEYKALVVAINAAIAAAARQSSSGGSTDYSRDMIAAKEAGDEAGYNAATAGRKNKETGNPNSTSVSTDRVGKVIDAAYNPNDSKHEQAKALVDDIKAGKKKFTNETVTAAGFRTGGYTGEWGPEGKLAFLHQKELILNKDDTANFLAAIQIVRGIVDFIDQQAHWASAGIGLMSATGVQDYNQTLEQMVEIKAEFPNATNHSEIEEAFHNLMNTASQYANRKNR